MIMKAFKLIAHQSSFSTEELIINLKDYPGLKEKDVVEIYHPGENELPRLLLQVSKTDGSGRAKDTISVEQSIAASFQLRTFADVVVNIVNVADVALDSVELTFRDQYMGRSEMWRLKNHLVNSCVYLNKKIEYCQSLLRCHVYEMWSQGDRVACGVITEETKIVFRSSTSMVYLFLQMSSEMWDVDIHGDLYFEKAVLGFLADLFAKWKKNGSNHEVTIVLFSRTFYKAKSLEEFPQHMRECLQLDYRGRFYEDFYRVAVQNERYEDWSNVLQQLRRLFSDYQKIVLQYHERPGMDIPTAINSTAAQGNFLEVLNMSLNVFEKHYLDRSFDRTGQLSVVITPGVGVFEVDRELTNVTKQRIIDNGVGSDLVCVGEQPLHAVPLLKFHNKDNTHNSIDDYSMPHWINLSFYSTNKKVAYSNFIPRIKLPPRKSQEPLKKMYDDDKKGKLLKEDEINSLFDYDTYDSQVFQLPPAHGTCVQRVARIKKTSVAGLEGLTRRSPPVSLHHRKMSDPDIHHSLTDILTNGVPLCKRGNGLNDTIDSPVSFNRLSPRSSISNHKPLIRTGRALINPFDPSHVTVKLTSNRRRWTHIFPKGPTGVLIQQHHYQARPAAEPAPPPKEPRIRTESSSYSNNNNTNTHSIYQVDGNMMSRKRVLSTSGALTIMASAVGTVSTTNNASLALLWGATGEQEWTPALTTGVDWKSLTIPACLPITTDYFPDKRSLQNDYLVSDYNLLPDDVNADFAQNRAIYKEPLVTNEVFKELVSQRLAQGFQLIVGVNDNEVIETHCPTTTAPPPSKVAPQTNKSNNSLKKRYLLSIGRIFHKLTLVGSMITVTRYRPRHPYPPFNIHYRYRFHAPYHDTYEVSWVSFTTEKLENYNWNYMDHYICTRGDTDFTLVEPLKYWRFRTLLLPLVQPATKILMEPDKTHCDIYPAATKDDLYQLTDGFLKMTEMYFNKVKRPNKQIKGSVASNSGPPPHLARRRHSTSILSRQTAQAGVSNSPFRERVGSTRLPDRPRLRTEAVIAAKAVLERTQSGEIDDTYDDSFYEPKLKSNASLSEIIERMRHPQLGVGFLQQTVSLPSQAFIAIYAIDWLQNNMECMTAEKATHIMEKLLKEKMICHASGDTTKRFVVGYYMYHILPQKKDKELTDYIKPLGDLQSFENEWMEVEVLEPRSPLLCNQTTAGGVHIVGAEHIADESAVPAFLADSIDPNYMHIDSDSDLPLYKNTHLDIDVSNRSDRIEWGHARYQATFRPDQAYEMCIQWTVATGNVVADLVSGWARKAQNCKLQMIPIPADPLALPFTLKSDPLRGPIYVPLNEDQLLENKSALFEGFPEETWLERLFLFQEAIVGRFGFIKCTVESTSHAGGSSASVGDHLYIHVTGNMFILIPTTVKNQRALRSRPVSKPLNASRYPVHNDAAPSPHEAYITRHVSGKNKNDYDNSRRTGFLWSWNHMISKRWKWTQAIATGDGAFQTKMLRDFKQFCANQDQRLTQFWDQCWKLKEAAHEIKTT